jgi:AcrR family transcriptional regulator
MANIKNNSASQETQNGFHAATIKEITDRAGASLASVNYHFRDKSELYTAVLRRIGEECAHIIPPDEELSGDAAMRFRQFIRWYCVKAIGRDRSPWEQILLAREMVQPTQALDLLLDAFFRPLNEKLSVLIAELLGVSPSDKSVALATASVFGQCLYHLKHHHLIDRMHPQLGKNPNVQDLASHIAEFSLAGLRGSRSLKRAAPKRSHLSRHTVG